MPSVHHQVDRWARLFPWRGRSIADPPLSDVFFVYTERRDLEAGVVLERGLTTKVTKLFAF
jgi:hypothetical protein